MELSVIRLFEAVILTNEGKLMLYVKTDHPDIEEAMKQAKEAAKKIFITHLMKISSFGWAFLDKVNLVEEQHDD